VKKPSQRLVLEDYQVLIGLVQDKNYPNDNLEKKLAKKIDQLENPPERKKSERVQFICVTCDHKFKASVRKCNKCASEDIKKLDDYFAEKVEDE
jgi:hypothetical protein